MSGEEDHTTIADRCQTDLFSNLYLRSTLTQRADALDYVQQLITHPDPGSEFAIKYGWLQPVLSCQGLAKVTLPFMVRYLFGNKYDALLLSITEDCPYRKVFVGSAAFQTHKSDKSLRVFAVNVLPAYQNRGLAKRMATDLLSLVLTADRFREIERVRFGKGGHESMSAILEHLQSREEYQHLVFEEENWISIPRN